MSVNFQDIENINNLFVTNYVNCFANYIRILHKDKQFKYKNNILNDNLNICNSKKELEKLLEFANEIKNINKSISNNDICIALLMVYYSLTVLEYDDELHINKLIKQIHKYAWLLAKSP